MSKSNIQIKIEKIYKALLFLNLEISPDIKNISNIKKKYREMAKIYHSDIFENVYKIDTSYEIDSQINIINKSKEILYNEIDFIKENYSLITEYDKFLKNKDSSSLETKIDEVIESKDYDIDYKLKFLLQAMQRQIEKDEENHIENLYIIQEEFFKVIKRVALKTSSLSEKNIDVDIFKKSLSKLTDSLNIQIKEKEENLEKEKEEYYFLKNVASKFDKILKNDLISIKNKFFRKRDNLNIKIDYVNKSILNEMEVSR